jgi:hypothetical protein
MKALITKGVLEPETVTSIVEEAKVLGNVSDQFVVIADGSTWQEVCVDSLEVFVHLEMQWDIKGLRRRGRDRNAKIGSQPNQLERCLLPLLNMATVTGQLH